MYVLYSGHFPYCWMEFCDASCTSLPNKLAIAQYKAQYIVNVSISRITESRSYEARISPLTKGMQGVFELLVRLHMCIHEHDAWTR